MRRAAAIILVFVLGFVVLSTDSVASAYSLEDEAGITAYVKLDHEINLTKIKSAFKSINYETESYIWGVLNIGAYREDLRPWAYVSADGWIFVYIPKEFSRTGVWYQGENNLEEGIKKIVDTLNYEENEFQSIRPNIKYYDFQFPNASGLYVFQEYCGEGHSNVLKVKVLNTTGEFKVEYGVQGSGSNSFYLDGVKILDSVSSYTYGEINESSFTKGVWHEFKLVVPWSGTSSPWLRLIVAIVA